MAPGILPPAISSRKNSPIRCSFCGLKCAPAGMSKLPSANAAGITASVSSAPEISDRIACRECIAAPPEFLAPSVAAGSVRARGAKSLQYLLMQPGAGVGKAAEDDTGQRRCRCERLYGRRNGNSGSPISRKSERASRDRGKRDRGKVVVARQFNRAAIARSKLRILIARTTVPDGTHGMDHMPRGKQMTLGDFSVAGLATAERPPFRQ